MCSSILAVYFKMFKSRVNKRVRVAYPCRVCVQEVLWGEDGIQCDGCSSWFHVGCIQMSKACYQSFSSNSHNNNIITGPVGKLSMLSIDGSGAVVQQSRCCRSTDRVLSFDRTGAVD